MIHPDKQSRSATFAATSATAVMAMAMGILFGLHSLFIGLIEVGAA